MRVLVDQDLCTGDGLCEEIAPDLFQLAADGLCYVRQGGQLLRGRGPAAVGQVAPEAEESAREAAEECPGECIFLESSSPQEPDPAA